jgi:site-specific recombinase XerD
MAKVYTGKVAIPGDKIQDYLKLMEEAEKQRQPFRDMLNELNDEFYDYLEAKFTPKTARKHTGVVELFTEFLCRHTDVERLEDVTRGMANTHFKQWWKRKVLDSTTPEQITVALKKFFTFLASEKGIVNEKVLKSFK